MQIGKYTVHSIESGSFALDGGAMFGIVPKTLWTSSYSTDNRNRIKIITRNLLLISDSKKILIDTGNGTKWTAKHQDIYGIDCRDNALEKSLAAYNLIPADITDVWLTHLHFDHTGGSTKLENNRLVPAFPNAHYYVQEDNLRWARQQNERDKASYLIDNYEPLFEQGILKQNLAEDHFWDDEIEIIRVNGHTYGQQLFKIFDSQNTVLFGADLFPLASHIPLPYIMAYDLQPLITLQEKKMLLATIVEENWKIFFEHDPVNTMATVKYGAKGFQIDECFNAI
jgi:glyoxylase-like metal-dependent hydrolase (beta-lactamase superfamily II)